MTPKYVTVLINRYQNISRYRNVRKYLVRFNLRKTYLFKEMAKHLNLKTLFYADLGKRLSERESERHRESIETERQRDSENILYFMQ